MRRKQQQLLDALVIQRTLRFLSGDCDVLDADPVRSRLLGHRADAGNAGRFQRLRGRSRPATRLKGARNHTISTAVRKKIVGSANPAAKSDDENYRRQRRRKTNLTKPCRRLQNQTMPKLSLTRSFQR